uniref:Heat shock protein 70 n=1 Tax=Daucus carota subsp. sativus TaxID=79200 RepID=A0A175YPM5_DAUCS
MAKNGVAVGIDLGTTYSCVGVWQHDRVEIIANDQGNRTTPSSVAFTDSERFIGDAAKNQAALNSVNTVFEFSRARGQKQQTTIDADGVLSVSAVETTTGIKKSIKIFKRGTLTKEEIERMVRDAEQYRIKDEEFMKKNNAMISYKDYVYKVRDDTQNNYHLEASVRKAISKCFEEAVEWLDANKNAEVHEYELRRQNFKAICNQILPGIAGT